MTEYFDWRDTMGEYWRDYDPELLPYKEDAIDMDDDELTDALESADVGEADYTVYVEMEGKDDISGEIDKRQEIVKGHGTMTDACEAVEKYMTDNYMSRSIMCYGYDLVAKFGDREIPLELTIYPDRILVSWSAWEYC